MRRPTAISTEWDRLVFHTEPYPTVKREPPTELVEGFKALYAVAWNGATWTCPVGDAKLVATLGSMTYFRLRDYEKSVQCLQELLTHPDFGALCSLEQEGVYERLGGSLFLAGFAEAGIEYWDRVREVEGHSRISRIRSLIIQVMIVADDLPPESALGTPLRSFLERLLMPHPKTKKLAGTAASCETFQDLRPILEQVFDRLR